MLELLTIINLICSHRNSDQEKELLCNMNINICFNWYKEQNKDLKEIDILKTCTKEVLEVDKGQ